MGGGTSTNFVALRDPIQAQVREPRKTSNTSQVSSEDVSETACTQPRSPACNVAESENSSHPPGSYKLFHFLCRRSCAPGLPVPGFCSARATESPPS